VFFFFAALLPSVHIKATDRYWFALMVGILNATIGWLLRLPLNIITLGHLFVVGLVVTAVV
jgi:putative membrane protein